MRVLIFIFIYIFTFGQVLFSANTKLEKKQKLIILKAIPKDMNTKVTFPEELRKGTSTAANFDVTYNGFSGEAQTAFQYAVDIWAALITSPVNIKVVANWTPLGAGVLGSAASYTFYRGFNNAPRTNTWYPVALAEKLYGSGLNHADSTDLIANFNSNFSSWYFGTDGNTPSGRYDFVSVVLHELCHGLGFQGSMDISGTQGSWGLGSGYPFAFDHYAQNGSGQSLLNTTLFPNPSTALAGQLKSNNIFFNGQNANSANGGSPPKLFAPATWEAGSSYSHLNESTFPAGNPNSLMTPSLGTAEAMHHPGNISLSMFKDMGWTVQLDVNYTSVYPGDTDNNGVINELDILPIGLYFLDQYYPRNSISFEWDAKQAIIWEDSAATYADANGDGIVDEKDVIGIGVNWGNTHSEKTESFEIDITNSQLVKQKRHNFRSLYNSLSGNGEAVIKIRTLLESILGIEKPLPKSFSLAQNYPNPFNPETNIRFILPEMQKVTLTIYNMLGQVVSIPINKRTYNTGIHAYKFYASQFPSGIYIYTVNTEKYNESRKMLFLR